MAVDVRPEVLVHRPRPDVAAYMFDPANDLAWTGGITASRPTQPGPLVHGASWNAPPGSLAAPSPTGTSSPHTNPTGSSN